MITSLGEEGAGRCDHLTRRRGSWSSTVITSRREKRAGRSAFVSMFCGFTLYYSVPRSAIFDCDIP